jgi:methionyl-tRNA synthetase
MALADRANEFVEARAPWALKKDPAKADELAAACTVSLNLFRQLCIYLAPVLPELAQKAAELLGASCSVWSDAAKPVLGITLAPFQHLVVRLDPAKTQAMVDASKTETPANAFSPAADTAPADDGAALSAEPIANTIAFEDFGKIDLRVARVLTAEEVPKAKKIIKLTVTLGGDDRRTVFAGIKTAYGDPSKLVGRLIVIVANLAAKPMSFGTSEGMAIAAGPGGSDIFLLSPDSGAKPGQRIH